MFLGRAHQASRYYGTLLKDIEKRIFVEWHCALAYYISAYTLFRIEWFIRRRLVDNKYRPFKYHLLGIILMQVAGVDMPAMVANRFEKYCEILKEVIFYDAKCLSAIQDACNLLDILVAGNYNMDKAKDSNIHEEAKKVILPPK